MEDFLKRKEGESDKKYIFRMYKNKDEYNLTNKEVHSIVCQQLGMNIAESSLRCKWTNYIEGYDDGYEIGLNENENVKKEEIVALQHEYEDYKQTKSYKETTEINADGSYTSDRLIGIEDENNLKDENFLLKVHNYDPKVWEIVSARNSIWNTQLKGGKITKLYASKINVKIRKQYKWNEEDIDKIFNNLKSIDKNTKIIKSKQYENNGKLLVVPIADFHFGLLSDIYSNNNDYNMEIAEDLFFTVINEVIENNKNKKF